MTTLFKSLFLIYAISAEIFIPTNAFALDLRVLGFSRPIDQIARLKPEFQIINEENVEVKIQIRTQGAEQWQEIIVAPDANRLLGCATCNFATVYEIQINSENNKQVLYSLSSGERYSIYWNTNEKKWDVRHLVN